MKYNSYAALAYREGPDGLTRYFLAVRENDESFEIPLVFVNTAVLREKPSLRLQVQELARAFSDTIVESFPVPMDKLDLGTDPGGYVTIDQLDALMFTAEGGKAS